MVSGIGMPETWEAALPVHRQRLVCYCLRLTGSADAAEDLAQETLYEAWRHLHQVYDPAGMERWLAAIARNVCRRWSQRRGREAAERERPVEGQGETASPLEEILPDGLDLEVELERQELAALLDRALALLPAETRAALIGRYVEDAPVAEVAARLRLTEGAVSMRIQRGKLALRRLLNSELREDAAAYGLVEPAADEWQQTRLWCPACGRQRLEGQLRPDQGELYLRCPGCFAVPNQNWHLMNASIGSALQGIHTYKPAVSRCLRLIYDLFQGQADDGTVRCPNCQTRLPIRRRDTFPGLDVPWHRSETLRLVCPTCRELNDHESWHSLTWSLPETRRFWREHPRMRFLPGREIEVDGNLAAVTGFASLTDGARLEAVFLRATGKVLRVSGAPAPTPGDK